MPAGFQLLVRILRFGHRWVTVSPNLIFHVRLVTA